LPYDTSPTRNTDPLRYDINGPPESPWHDPLAVFHAHTDVAV